MLLDRDAPGITVDGGFVHVRRLDTPGTGLLVVRPDGYVGACAARAADPAVTAWMAAVGAPVTTGPLP